MNNRLRNGRVQTKGFDAVQQITPAGLPGSTYVRPLEQGHPGANLAALSEAFSGLSSTINQYNADRNSQAARDAAAAKAEAAEAARTQRETEAAARESARDATASAKSQDDVNKLRAEQLPWPTFSEADLKGVVKENDNPNGNIFAYRMASATLGKKAGEGFRATLTDLYKDYDPSKGSVRQYLEGETQKWLNEQYPDMKSEQQVLARQGAWSIIDTDISTLETKEKAFHDDTTKQAYADGITADASNTIIDGQNKHLAPKVIASDFLASWSDFRKAAQTGDRANPQLQGVDYNTPFKAAVAGQAEQGNVELVTEMLTTQVPGMRAALINDPEHQKWAEETKSKAIQVSLEKTRGNAMATRANLKYLASIGDLNDQLIKSSVDSGVLTAAEGEDYMVVSRTSKASAITKARTAAGKSQAEANYNADVDSITVGNLDTAVSGGGLSGIQDRQVRAKDGSGTTTITVKQQLDATTDKWEEQHAQKVEEVKNAQGPEAAAEFDINSKIDFYGANYQLENKQWKALFGGVTGGASISRWVASGGKDVPKDVALAMQTYDKLADKDPTLAAAYVTDEKTRVVLEAYHIAQSQANVYSGGGVSTPEQAMGTALDIAKRIAEFPDTVKGVHWTDSTRAKLTSQIKTTGQSFGGFYKGIVPDDLNSKTMKLADFYKQSGLGEDEAIARAVEVVKADYVQVHADFTGGGYLVDSKGITDKTGFVDFMDTVIPEKVDIARGGPQDPSLGGNDFIPVRVGDNWMLKATEGNAILTDKQGKAVIITPGDYDRFKERRLNTALAEAERVAGGKKGAWEILWNSLTNAEDRNRFWAMKAKWEASQEKEAQWERMRLDKESSNGKDIVHRVSDMVTKKMADGREQMVADVNPAFFAAATPDLSPLMDNPAPTDGTYTVDTLKPLVINAESTNDPYAVSPTGNHFGLMQLGVDTGAVDAAKALGMTDYVNADREHRIDMLMDKDTNEKLGTKYLDMMLTKYKGNAEQALVAYNWGQGNADKWIADGSKWADLPDETKGYVKKIMANAPTQSGPEANYTKGKYGTKIEYANKGAVRSHPVTPTLEAKLDYSVSSFFGPGYSVKVFSGGQAAKGTGGPRTGSNRHDDHGHGGRAADVYIIDPNGNKVRDRSKLLRFKSLWVAKGMGSVGTFMSDFGMHLDEFTQDKLGHGQSLAWTY